MYPAFIYLFRQNHVIFFTPFQSDLTKYRTNDNAYKSYGFRPFALSAPELWNKLLDDIRSCDNSNLFKRKLKTHLFKNYFNTEFFSYP